jgi:hypothetical protein
MQATIKRAEIECQCQCGYADTIHIDDAVEVDYLDVYIENELEELGWNFGDCPECALESIKESRGCHDLHVERDYMFA